MKGKRLLALLMALSLLCGLVITPASAVSFRDAQNNWASAAIERWSEAGVVVGDENGNFNPAANMTRAEFAVVLNRVMQYQTTASNPFSDVPGDSWYSDAVLKAYAAGVISGTSPTTMSPTANLTREQAMVLLGRALGIPENASAASRFTDHSEISPFAVGYVGGMADAGYIQGNDGKVNPKANITRAEVVTILNNIITTWASKSGQTVTGTGKGITVIAAPNVTVTGRVDALMVTPGAGSGTLSLKDAKVSGTMTVTAPSVSLSLDGSASISKVVVDETAKGAAITLGKDASIGTLISSADSVKVLGNGSINRMTVSAGSGVTVSKDVVVSTLVNDGNSGVQLGDTVVSAGQRSTAGDTGTTTKPQESKKPSGGGGGGGGNSSSGGSSGGGGNNGGGGNTPTPTPTPIKPDGGGSDIKTADQLVKAAGDNAKDVKVDVADVNELTAADNVTITNNTSGLETLTLNLGSANLGNVTIQSSTAKTVEIKGDGTFQSLTINTPNATVNNRVDVNGGVTIDAVSNSSFHLFSRVLSILLKGPGKLEIKDEAPSVPDVTVNTTENVILAGKVENVVVTSDGANVSLNTTGSNTVVDSQGANSTITLNTDKTVTLSGAVGTVNTNPDKNTNINLTGNATVRQLNAIKNTTISGSGTVSNVNTESDITLNVPVGKVNVSSKTSVSISGSASVGTVTTGTSISLNVSVEKVAVTDSDSDNEVSITLARDKTISTLETSKSIEIKGSGSVVSVDVNASAGKNVEVTVSENATVDQVANTSDPSSSGTVTIDKTSDTATAPDVVKTKAQAPTDKDVTFERSETDSDKAIIRISEELVNKLQSSEDKITWKDITTVTTDIKTGVTYYVRTKAAGTTLASEPMIGIVPKVYAVTSANITGTPTVGQTLTAVANADATVPLSYQWYLGDTAISGATGKTLTLTGEHSGQTIKVRIYNEYNTSDTFMSNPTAEIAPDVSALNSMINQADTVQVGVKPETETDPGKVPAGVVFVSQADWDALTTVKDTASNALTAKTQAEVDKAVTALQAAIKTFQNAKKTGTMTEVDKLVEALKETMDDARTLGTSAVVGTDDMSVKPNVKWVPDATMKALGTAIDDAAKAIAENPTAETLSTAMTDLNNAMVKFQRAIGTGAAIDNSKLVAAIANAESVQKLVKPGTSAEEVEPGLQWALQKDIDVFTAALDTARNIQAEKQGDILAAVDALNAAISKFQAVVSYGATLDAAALQTAITNAEANLKSVEISEDDDVDADKTYVTQKVYDDYKGAIETAKTATGLDTQSKLQGILDTLNKATDTFNAQKKGGNVKSFAVTFEAAPANGAVSVKAGDVVVNTGDPVRAGTRITITVTPATGYMLESLKINDVDQLAAVSENSITVTVNDVTTIAATFKLAPVEYTVTITDTPNGTVTVMNGDTVVNNGDKVAEGTVLTVTVTPNDNFIRDQFSITGTAPLTDVENQYRVIGDVTITATFKALFNVTVKQPTDGGSLTVMDGTLNIPIQGMVIEGNTITISVTALDGYRVKEVMANNTALQVNGEGKYTHVVTADVTITVTFETTAPGNVTVTVAAPGNGNTLSVQAGGTAVTSGGTVAVGTELTITATPATGYKIKEVKANEAPLKANEDGTYTYTANADVSISATFVQEVAVTIKAYGAGTLTVTNGDTPVANGTKVAVGTELTITAIPTAESGYVLESLTANNSNVSDGSITVSEATTIEAVFIYEMTDPVYNVVYTLSSGVKSTVTKDESTNVYTLTLGGASTTPGIPTANSITDFAKQFFFGSISDANALTSALNEKGITHYTAIAIDFSKFKNVWDFKLEDETSYSVSLNDSPILAVYGEPSSNGSIYKDGETWCKYFFGNASTGELGSILNANGMAFLLAEDENPTITFTVKPSDGSKAAQTIRINIVNKITYLDADTAATE